MQRADVLGLFGPLTLARGVVDRFTIADPPPATNFTRRVAQGYAERIRAMFFLFTTDVNAANRTIAIEYRDADGNALAGSSGGVFQVASQATRWYAGIGLPLNTITQGVRQTMGLPDVWLLPGEQMVSNIPTFQAGDQLSAIRGIVERISLGADGFPLNESHIEDTERGRGWERALERT